MTDVKPPPPPLPLAHEPARAPTLARTMGLFALVAYGVGDMIGAGVYVTIGRAAGQMGNAVWLAFVASMVAALLTGLSYASIASRYPRAAGAAYVTHRAFHFPLLSYVVGLATTASGLTSMAAGANGFAEGLRSLVNGPPPWVIILAFLGLLGALNFWGIRESMWMNLLCTFVEVGGLVFVIAVGAKYWGGVNYLEAPAPGGGTATPGVLLVLNGAVLTFFSFIGFEDMLNVSEEVKDPVRTVPRGLIIALAVVTVLYIAMSITAVSVVNYRELADPKLGAPLAQITKKAAPWLSPWVFTGITLFAVTNTALINYIMGSRLLYGMSRQGLLPKALGKVHPTRRTPHVAVMTLLVVVVILALSGGVAQLASATSLLLLSCFVVVNVALIVLKSRPAEPRGSFEVPSLVPALGALVCAALIVSRVTTRNAAGEFEWRAPLTAGAVLLGILVLYVLMRPTRVIEEEVE
jgi:APA family basic amino acid/polyamine antiporter